MKLLKKIPFFLFLLVLFFCLHGSVENYGYLNVLEVVEVACIALLCMAVFFGTDLANHKKLSFCFAVNIFSSPSGICFLVLFTILLKPQFFFTVSGILYRIASGAAGF